MKSAAFFHRNRVFTHAEYLAACANEQSHSRRTQDSLLAYHVRKGHLLRLRRGLYAVIEPGSGPQSQPVDPFLVASKLTEGAVLAYHTALEFHGRAYSVHEQFTYLTDRTVKPFRFRFQVFRPVPFPRALTTRAKQLFDVQSQDRSAATVQVTSLERTLVDVLDRPDLCGGWEEVWRSLELVEFFALDRAVEYALMLNNATVAAKVGFFLDRHRKALMVEEKHLRPLKESRPKSLHYMERRRRQKNRVVREWNLVVPQRILDRTWGEVL